MAATALSLVMGKPADKIDTPAPPAPKTCTDEFKQAQKTPSRVEVLNDLIKILESKDANNHPYVQAMANGKSAEATKNRLLAGVATIEVTEKRGTSTEELALLNSLENASYDPKFVHPDTGALSQLQLLPLTAIELYSKHGHLTDDPSHQAHAKEFIGTYLKIKEFKNDKKPVPKELTEKLKKLEPGNAPILEIAARTRNNIILGERYAVEISGGKYTNAQHYPGWVSGKGMLNSLSGSLADKPVASHRKWKAQVDANKNFFFEERDVQVTRTKVDAKTNGKNKKSTVKSKGEKPETETVTIRKKVALTGTEAIEKMAAPALNPVKIARSNQTLSLASALIEAHTKNMRASVVASVCPTQPSSPTVIASVAGKTPQKGL